MRSQGLFGAKRFTTVTLPFPLKGREVNTGNEKLKKNVPFKCPFCKIRYPFFNIYDGKKLPRYLIPKTQINSKGKCFTETAVAEVHPLKNSCKCNHDIKITRCGKFTHPSSYPYFLVDK